MLSSSLIRYEHKKEKRRQREDNNNKYYYYEGKLGRDGQKDIEA